MRIKSVKLTGFKGFKAGMGVDTVSLNFDALPDGLIALVGKNGMGKTTLLDNLQPFRLMPYKLRESKEWSPASFSFYDQCSGEASKELIFEINNIVYRSLVLIDADKRKQEAFLFQQEGPGWLPLNDGKTRTYDAAVEKVAGSPTLFFSSAFRSQDARKLSSYPRSEILQIITGLLNIDHIKEQGDKAKQVADTLLNECGTIRGAIATLDADIATGGVLAINLQDLNNGLEDKQFLLDGKRTALKNNTQQQHDVEVASAAQVEARKRLEGLQARLEELKQHQTGLTTTHGKRLVELQAGLASVRTDMGTHTDTITTGNNRIDALAREIETISNELAAMDTHKAVADMETVHTGKLTLAKDELARLTLEYQGSVTAVSEYNKLLANIADIKNRRLLIETNAENKRQRIREKMLDIERQAGLLEGLDCRADRSGWVNDSCSLLKDAIAARDSLPPIKAELDDACKPSQEMMDIEMEAAAADLIFEITKDPAVKQAEMMEAGKAKRAEVVELEKLVAECQAAGKRVADLQVKAATLDFKKQEQTTALASIETAQQARDCLLVSEKEWLDKLEQVSIEYQQQLTIEAEKQGEVNSEIDALLQTLSGDVEQQLADLRQAAEGISRDIAACEESVTTMHGKIAVLKNKLADIDLKKIERDSLTNKLHMVDEEIINWRLITQACSNDGIIALEIDDAGPAIAGIANDLLAACYGPRFSVRLETQSEKTDGGMKEVFDILVLDSERDEIKSIRDMSGGEVTTIEDAITRAICLYNLGKSNIVYDTLFSDEKDGALDASRKIEFLQIKRRAMEIGTHRQELFISQTPELHEMADARIVLTESGVTIK